MLRLNLRVSLESLINLTLIFLCSGRKSEYPERTCTSQRKDSAGIRTRNLLAVRREGGANHHTTTQLSSKSICSIFVAMYMITDTHLHVYWLFPHI